MVELQEEDVLAKVVVKFKVVRLYLACCSKSLRTESGTLPKGAPEGLGDIQILAKSAFKSWSFSEKQGCPTLYHLEVEGGGLWVFGGGFGYLPSARFAAVRSLLNQASLIPELRGNIADGPVGLSSWTATSSSIPMIAVAGLGTESLGSGNLRIRRKVSTSSAY